MTGVGAAYPLTEMEEEVMGYFVYHRDDKT